MTFLTFPKELTEKLKKKCAASPQPTEQNLLHMEGIFKDTVELHECPWDSSGWRYPQT